MLPELNNVAKKQRRVTDRPRVLLMADLNNRQARKGPLAD
jgi:hypothetical protein